ncbi:PTS system D-fructose-specific IIB component (F1P-forming) (Frc family) /PTS system D-fructose-specific IIC component (F1P-forming) (Frc family) [Prauserella shujinwangii]|uniref:PTS system D-fructose-specific IIB component (F1P-forming) (Frc family) /PTS system D-fructose-specific IIC component (F1P-forming) (Frc family) n=1 Tax=Prauserella shujinwangii TaxID=1453103 RepID=A0A2T0LX75_9PSEU|nr:PTS fructose transporter subunit IIBC [Prauserella shujinwangii]PRX48624.1 PTS system D-fructose-specific IIB component (F1P-forming) (Frc family) /PTS system D-fructose-specific IIC component (F1P-forming) (Frc family) [Prauserella shujinwangii]
MRFVAVTSCPTGIAHTYMAAESLEQAAKAAGHEIAVETQGAAGSTPLTARQIAEADAVVFAADVDVRDRARFAGKPLVTGGVKAAINDGARLIAEAEAAAERGAGAAADPAPGAGPELATKVEAGAGAGTRLRQWLMTGVSYMIPFVAAGGILIAVAFLLGGAEIAAVVNGGEFGGVTYEGISDPSDLLAQAGIAGVLFKIGTTAFEMLVPILSGFIAFGMADRPGIAPGVVGGLLASAIGAGFLGGLVSGLLAGAVVLGLKRVPVPRGVAGVMPVVVIPLLATLVVGVLMVVVVGEPIAAAQGALTGWLSGLSGGTAWLLGALLGLMMAFDMGGPVNKVAYTFGLAALASGDTVIMAAVMAAGMTPPLGLALATVLRRRLFTKSERDAGKAAWLLGASFITEGAIPFAAADPFRIIPSLMVGSATTGALSVVFAATSPAPHGGIWVVGLIGHPLLYLLAVAIGAVVTCACVLVAKSVGRPRAAETTTSTTPAGQPVTV